MIVHRIPQRSPEWYALRLGRVTGSRVAAIFATIQKGEAAKRRNLRTDLVLERLTGAAQDSDYVNQAMQDGIDREPDALAIYQALTGTLVDESVGFVAHDSLMAGCSPDGVVGDFVGLIEIKAPKPATHLEYLTSGKIPHDYLKQVTHSLWITGAEWCDWLSYQPLFPDGLRVKLTRVNREDVDLGIHQIAVEHFLKEVDTEEASLRTMVDVAAVLKAAVA